LDPKKKKAISLHKREKKKRRQLGDARAAKKKEKKTSLKDFVRRELPAKKRNRKKDNAGGIWDAEKRGKKAEGKKHGAMKRCEYVGVKTYGKKKKKRGKKVATKPENLGLPKSRKKEAAKNIEFPGALPEKRGKKKRGGSGEAAGRLWGRESPPETSVGGGEYQLGGGPAPRKTRETSNQGDERKRGGL